MPGVFQDPVEPVQCRTGTANLCRQAFQQKVYCRGKLLNLGGLSDKVNALFEHRWWCIGHAWIGLPAGQAIQLIDKCLIGAPCKIMPGQAQQVADLVNAKSLKQHSLVVVESEPLN